MKLLQARSPLGFSEGGCPALPLCNALTFFKDDLKAKTQAEVSAGDDASHVVQQLLHAQIPDALAKKGPKVIC